MQSASTGGLLLLLAGIMNGSFALPMKKMPRWRWENVWFVWSIVALVVFPLLTALYFVPHYICGLREIPVRALVLVMTCGMAWGIAQVFFGLSVTAIGIALTFSLVLGISAALGAVVPFLSLHATLLHARAGAYLFLGLAALTIGMVLCARAGVLRERIVGRASGAQSFSLGLALAIVSGLLASAMNIGFSFSAALHEMAIKHGAIFSTAAMAVWFPLLLGGALPNLGYTIYLLQRERGIELYMARGTQTYWLFTLCMAILWFSSTILYGVASMLLGSLGTVFGWPVFMSIVVMVASFLGWITGEWKGSGLKPKLTQATGLLMLIVAVVLFSKAVV
jgi:L-rhamnose-H+ transport protein